MEAFFSVSDTFWANPLAVALKQAANKKIRVNFIIKKFFLIHLRRE
jgi:hypothetical protein